MRAFRAAIAAKHPVAPPAQTPHTVHAGACGPCACHTAQASTFSTPNCCSTSASRAATSANSSPRLSRLAARAWNTGGVWGLSVNSRTLGRWGASARKACRVAGPRRGRGWEKPCRAYFCSSRAPSSPATRRGKTGQATAASLGDHVCGPVPGPLRAAIRLEEAWESQGGLFWLAVSPSA